MNSDRVRLDLDGAIAVITNDRPDKHNAFDDDMDARLFEILAEIRANPEIRAVVWRAEGEIVLCGSRCKRDRHVAGRADPPRAHAPRASRHPTALGARSSGDSCAEGLGHGRLVPENAPL